LSVDKAALKSTAPAKVNLFLHVGGPDDAGYHPIRSLAAFADVGDIVTVSPAERLSLSVSGPFAVDLGGDVEDNLISRALRLLGKVAGIGDPRLAITLDKRLPVAAGLGGGSSDVGAALKLARALAAPHLADETLEAVALEVGADGPLCLWAKPALVSGLGEHLAPAPRLPLMHAVLLNPRVPSPTGPVYRAYDDDPAWAARFDAGDKPVPEGFDTVAGLGAWLGRQRNDLEAPAMRLTPMIRDRLAAMAAVEGVRLARLSGSGATVFGLFDDAQTADRAARRLSAEQPGDWISACRLMPN
jgi:4-diphosphocytidyl-2-C-methyl-D-erythritol kinase